MANEQIEKELDFLRANFACLNEREKRLLWAQLSDLCEGVALSVSGKPREGKKE